MSRESAVRIALLLPDVLGTYSDRGNAVVLAQRLRWRGVAADVVEVPAGTTPPTDCDLFVIGGGEDAAQAYAAEWLTGHPRLVTALATRQVLAVCAGLQVLGQWVEDVDGNCTTGAGVLDVFTSPGARRAVGEVVVAPAVPGAAPLTGFENHQGLTTRGPGTAPLGRVLAGTGNGDGTDGVLTDTVVATYLHGPVLARNPELADLLLRRATGLALPPLEVPGVQAARELHLGLGGRRTRRRPALPSFGRRTPGRTTGGSR